MRHLVWIFLLVVGCNADVIADGHQSACGDYGSFLFLTPIVMEGELTAMPGLGEMDEIRGVGLERELIGSGLQVQPETGSGSVGPSRPATSVACWSETRRGDEASVDLGLAELEIVDVEMHSSSGGALIEAGELVHISAILVNRGDEAWSPAPDQQTGRLPEVPAAQLWLEGDSSLRVASAPVADVDAAAGTACTTLRTLPAGGVHTLHFQVQVSEEARPGDQVEVHLSADGERVEDSSRLELRVGELLRPAWAPSF